MSVPGPPQPSASPQVRQATCVAIGARAVLIEGPSGSGKSSLALELIDRGGVLVGDDGVQLAVRGGQILASPHPRTRGLIEVRNLGLLPAPVCEEARVALAILFDADAPRFIERAPKIHIQGLALPQIRIWPGSGPVALKVLWALDHHGLPDR